MHPINTHPQVYTGFQITVSREEMSHKLRGVNKESIAAAANETLEQINNCWNPAIVYRWLPIAQNKKESDLFLLGENNSTALDLGHSSRFLAEAEFALIASYTAGEVLEKKGQKASKKQKFFAAYIIDILGLLILEKTGNLVTQIAEKQAAEIGWGVSPFLSPGSVHGWELKEQLKLAPLLPLNKINLSLSSGGVLTPFKSLTCLIGIGPGYTSRQVGTTCQVCSKNKDCQIRLQS